jgi:hypothetical protein
LISNSASDNTATGYQALYTNTGGANNTAIGFEALNKNSSGSNNIAVGASAGSVLDTGSNNIGIGAAGATAESNTIRIGKRGVQTAAYMIGIHGATVAGGTAVMVDSNGHLGTLTSSARYKRDIRPMDKSSEALLSLHPVTFRYKKELDSLGIPQFGLVAEQVEKVDPDLVLHDADGKPYTVRYEAVNAMLLNEFLKAHRQVQEQQSELAAVRKELSSLKSALRAQAAQIEKVAAQVSTDNPPARTVKNE